MNKYKCQHSVFLLCENERNCTFSISWKVLKRLFQDFGMCK
ncbi:hypothetical protein BVRB_3g068710 [Beta vulgaris subsp. vulgaris]|nr:hypothetical protein BVRB_3g068710 [Beta vulgaris subsp. vulgaris]